MMVMDTRIFNPAEINRVIELSGVLNNVVRTNKKQLVYNIPASFDIETSSFFRTYGNEKIKTAIMYGWTFGLNGLVVLGRTWDEFIMMLDILANRLGTFKDCKLIIYIHNLGYEFQFMRKYFEWEKVFSLDTRKPVYARTKNGIEFRCSYLLTGYSLENLGKQLKKYPVDKMIGDLDYSKIRHSGTPLTNKEIGYMVNDVKIVMSAVQEKIENDGDITRIPLTKTGYVRNYCRKKCLYDKNEINQYNKYMELMKNMVLEPDEYSQLKRAFQGGFTHANAQYSGKVLERVSSFDFTSSYPYVMISEKFPMRTSIKYNLTGGLDELHHLLNKYCCVFDIQFFDLYPRNFYEHYISSSRCYKKVGVIEDNGRVVSADSLVTTITNVDFDIINNFYEYSAFKINNLRLYEKHFLPIEFIKSILKLYQDKTTLKGIEGREVDYLLSKEMLNSCYGMTVTDICRDDIIYDNLSEWEISKPDLPKMINKYNNSKRRFLFYPWGIFVTAYARRNLFTGILACGNDYVYSDTDSIKIRNVDNHWNYINNYNSGVIDKLKLISEYREIPYELFSPKTITNKIKTLGVWDFEGTYSRFKTLGAKRYMYEQDGKINITVSGVNKKIAVPYLLNEYGENTFEAFKEGLYIPPEFTGKNTHTYIDEEMSGILKDYLGNVLPFHEKSGVHLEPADYTLSLSIQYLNYLRGLKDFES